MRTLEQMVARVRRLLNDTHGTKYKKELIIDYLTDSANALWEDLLNHNNGREALKCFGPSVVLAAHQRFVTMPTDMMRIYKVQICNYDVGSLDKSQDWRDLTYSTLEEGSDSGVAGSTTMWGSLSSVGGTSLIWQPGEEQDEVQLHPHESVQPSFRLRFVYYRRPFFPMDDRGTFNDPTGASTVAVPVNLYKLPERCAEAVEFYCAALFGTEERKDRKKIDINGQMYSGAFQSIVKQVTRSKPNRRYINQTRS